MSGGRKIVLHLGLHKTGTTTIQNVLHANREYLLAEEGVLYPSIAPNLSSPLLTIFREDPRKLKVNKVAGYSEEEMVRRRRKFLKSLDDEISLTEWDTLLLSAEGLSFLSAAELGRLREWVEGYASEWLVLVCVRHPVDWTRSVVQERLKQGDTLRQLYRKLPMPRYQLKLSRAISAFGRESVRVFDFESAVAGEGGIVGAFARQAGLSGRSAEFLASRAGRRYNESLSMEAALILDALNRRRPMLVRGVRAPRRAGPGRELPYIGRIRGRKFDVPDPVKDDVRSLSREDVGWINGEFGLHLYPDVAQTISPLQTQGQEEPVWAPGGAAVEGIAEVLGDLVAENAFRRLLEQGEEALARGELKRARRLLEEAVRLDPDAPHPKRLLEQANAEGAQEGTATQRQGRLSRRIKP